MLKTDIKYYKIKFNKLKPNKLDDMKDMLNDLDNYGYIEDGIYIYNLGVELAFREKK